MTQYITCEEARKILANHNRTGAAQRSFCLSKHHHASKSEATYCNWLLARQQNKEIIRYEQQPSVELRIRGKRWKRWKIDFKVFEKDRTVSYHECKGWNLSDSNFKLKRDAFRICYPKAKLYVNKELYTGQTLRSKTFGFIQRLRKRNAAARNFKPSFGPR